MNHTALVGENVSVAAVFSKKTDMLTIERIDCVPRDQYELKLNERVTLLLASSEAEAPVVGIEIAGVKKMLIGLQCFFPGRWKLRSVLNILTRHLGVAVLLGADQVIRDKINTFLDYYDETEFVLQ